VLRALPVQKEPQEPPALQVNKGNRVSEGQVEPDQKEQQVLLGRRVQQGKMEKIMTLRLCWTCKL